MAYENEMIELYGVAVFQRIVAEATSAVPILPERSVPFSHSSLQLDDDNPRD